MSVSLYHGDCLDILPTIPDKSVDLILCDLPYGTTACKWDTVIDMGKLWEQYERIITDVGAIVLFGIEPFSSYVRMSNPKLYKYDWVFEKSNAANFLNAKYQPLRKHESIMVFSKSAAAYSNKSIMTYNPQMSEGKAYTYKSGEQKTEKHNATVSSKIEQVITDNKGTRYPTSIIKFKPDKEKLHPTQKPVELCEYLIKTYTHERGVVLDNCMGSGTTGVACINTNRDFIGIELEKEYFEIAKRRTNGI